MSKVIITGASGMVGKAVLLECFDNKDITHILSIVRSESGLKHSKLKEVVHQDFSEFASISAELTGFDACFFCMGVSAAGISKAKYEKITYNYTIELATELYNLSPEITFNYVSGKGTDSSEKGRVHWARIKGKTENAILNMGFKQAYMFRPGAIIPLKGIKSKTRFYQFMYDYFTWMIKITKILSPNSVINTTQMGISMIKSISLGYDKKILNPPDIIKLSK